MKTSIVLKLQKLKNRYEEIAILLKQTDIISNRKYFRKLSNEYSKLSYITNYFNEWYQIQENIKITEQLLMDPEIHDIAQDELKIFNNNLIQLEKKLHLLLNNTQEDDIHGCLLEIRAGTGGNEAALFANVLLKMYTRFAENHCWKIDVISISNSPHGGYKEIIAQVPNNGAYGCFKFESGGHRVQRIPETENQGRIHTSTCTVAIMPKINNNELTKINTNDLRIDSFRASGAGGQHVNTTDSAIRITHIPSGIVVECQDERSQHKNKAKALTVLNTRLQHLAFRRRQQAEANTRRNLLGTGDRCDRIRTYNFPQRRVTDHRIGLTTYKLEEIIRGNLDILIQPMMEKHKFNQLDILSK